MEAWEKKRDKILEIVKERKYNGFMRDTLNALVVLERGAQAREAMADKLLLMLEEETNEKALIKATQPLLRTQTEELDKLRERK